VNIPVGTQLAKVHVPILDLSHLQITENATVVWSDDQFIAGVAGIYNASKENNSVVFMIGSGSYQFVTTGETANNTCVAVPEYSNATLNCPTGLVFSEILFASFGTPTGGCSTPAFGKCDAGSSFMVVENMCLGKESCTVPAQDTVFGDPCLGTLKNLIIQAVCNIP